MGDFFIGKTNFGVEVDESRFDLANSAGGGLLLTVEIRGSKDVYEIITADEASEWSWTLYPPYFYLRDYPVSENTKGTQRVIELQPEDSDNFDIALYLMEHNDVEGVVLKVSENRIEISGQVDLMGDFRAFRIDWAR